MNVHYKIFYLILLSLFLGACSGTYYSAMEQIGVHKREIMVDRIKDAESSQQDAKEQFKSALEELSSLINFDGGELEKKYKAVESKYEASKQAADEVGTRIDKIEDVAKALFKEWEAEIELISNPSYRRQSAAKLKETKLRYSGLIRSMRNAEGKMEPILTALRDNTLFLKHNLNAQAIGALQGEMQSIERDVDILIQEMNEAIAQSQEFINLIEN